MSNKALVGYAHVRCNTADPHSGGFTVAFHLDPVRPYGSSTRVIPYGYARCNPKDQFNKAIGRKIATNRLRLNIEDTALLETPVVIKTRAKTYKGIVKAVVAQVQKDITAEFRNRERYMRVTGQK